MKLLLALALALVAAAAPATANAARFAYSASFEYRSSGAASGDVYSAAGTFDADLVQTVDGIFGPLRIYDITGATGKLSTDFNPDFGNVIGVDAYNRPLPGFALLSNDALFFADFSLFADSWRNFDVSWSGFGGSRGRSGEVDGPITAISITAAGGVPEPATWGLMILGFGAIGFALRRRTAERVALA